MPVSQKEIDSASEVVSKDLKFIRNSHTKRRLNLLEFKLVFSIIR